MPYDSILTIDPAPFYLDCIESFFEELDQPIHASGDDPRRDCAISCWSNHLALLIKLSLKRQSCKNSSGFIV
jgi:hypothetical protein